MCKKRAKKHPTHKNHFWFFLFLTVAMIFFSTVAFGFDKKFMERVIFISEIQTITNLNTSISKGLKECMVDKNIVYTDFINIKSNVFAANSVLINDICTNLAESISKDLSLLENEQIKIPMGAVLGVESLANYGPYINFTLMPVGTATVDYETTMTSKGINQIHFQVVLKINAKVMIVNPLYKKELTVNRNVAVIDTLISGDVPQGFYGSGENSGIIVNP